MPNIQCYSSLPQLFAHERNNHIIRVIPIILPIILDYWLSMLHHKNVSRYVQEDQLFLTG